MDRRATRVAGQRRRLEKPCLPLRGLAPKDVTLTADRDLHLNQVVQIPDNVGPLQLPLLARQRSSSSLRNRSARNEQNTCPRIVSSHL